MINFLYSCKSENEVSFRSKYKVGETIVTYQATKNRNSSAYGLYNYHVGADSYRAEGSRTNLLYPGDQFRMLYNMDNPKDYYIMFYQPVYPPMDSLFRTSTISYNLHHGSFGSMYFRYEYMGVKFRRWIGFEEKWYNLIDSLSQNDLDIPILVYRPFPFKAYIDTARLRNEYLLN